VVQGGRGVKRTEEEGDHTISESVMDNTVELVVHDGRRVKEEERKKRKEKRRKKRGRKCHVHVTAQLQLRRPSRHPRFLPPNCQTAKTQHPWDFLD
jgi:hypothetical protein